MGMKRDQKKNEGKNSEGRPESEASLGEVWEVALSLSDHRSSNFMSAGFAHCSSLKHRWMCCMGSYASPRSRLNPTSSTLTWSSLPSVPARHVGEIDIAQVQVTLTFWTPHVPHHARCLRRWQHGVTWVAQKRGRFCDVLLRPLPALQVK